VALQQQQQDAKAIQGYTAGRIPGESSWTLASKCAGLTACRF
jgi:hypothetical protein